MGGQGEGSRTSAVISAERLQCSRNRSSFGNIVCERHRCMLVCVLVLVLLASPCSQPGSQLHCPHQHSRIWHRPGTGSLASTGSASTVCPSILAMHATALNYYVERSDYESYGSLGNGDSESEASPGCISSASSRAGTPPPPPASESTDAAFLGKVRYATSHPTI